jgi:hypothetical protein
VEKAFNLLHYANRFALERQKPGLIRGHPDCRYANPHPLRRIECNNVGWGEVLDKNQAENDTKMRRWYRLVSRVLVLLPVLIGTSGVTLASGLPPLRVKVGDKAPNFTLRSSEGNQVRLSEFAGQNVLIDFYRGYW